MINEVPTSSAQIQALLIEKANTLKVLVRETSPEIIAGCRLTMAQLDRHVDNLRSNLVRSSSVAILYTRKVG